MADLLSNLHRRPGRATGGRRVLSGRRAGSLTIRMKYCKTKGRDAPKIWACLNLGLGLLMVHSPSFYNLVNHCKGLIS